MNADAELLVENYAAQNVEYRESPRFFLLRHNVSYLSDLDPDFPIAANKLISTGTEMEINAVKVSLSTWLHDDEGVPALHNTLEESGKDGTSGPALTHYLLTDAIESRSLTCIRVGLNYRWPADHMLHSFGMSVAGHQGESLLLEHGVTTRPDLLSLTKEEVDSYYHPIAVASRVIMPKGKSQKHDPDIERFILEYPVFKEWVTEQPDMDTALQQALDTKSLHPPTIEALSMMQNDTAAPLHQGLL
jgi:hypothetical protein